MREIILLQIGQCGNQIGIKFWEEIVQEHRIDENGQLIQQDLQFQQNLDVYFNEVDGNRYIPRNVLIDLESETLDNVRASKYGKLFRPDNFIQNQGGTCNNFAIGHYTKGNEILNKVLDVIRHQVENADCLQGFQLTHSLGGGTGSGFGTLLLSKLQEDYFDKIFQSYSVFPLEEYYNTAITVNHLIENCSQCISIDNEALYKICMNKLKLKNICYEDLNNIISALMSGTTCSLRFPNQLNSSLRQLSVNLILFKSINLLYLFRDCISLQLHMLLQLLNTVYLIDQMFDPQNQFCAIHCKQGRYQTGACLFRGQFSSFELENQMMQFLKKNHQKLVQNLPNNLNISQCNVSQKGLVNSGTFIGNTTAIKQMFKRIYNNFQAILKRKAFLHWYINEGMDELEFIEAGQNIQNLISEYQQYSEIDDYEEEQQE
ncbi:unnamed protein product [Paramecium sonneborni]|uniref:Tubulin/FtsZ GTPase domain-containing protein n=1 Tax=Paramecium sonneborni TaxID=65129 RepID=A0A8S1P6T0_9CILI|nr:unnamed protein product [Paramecium sonneborni]